MPDTKSDGRSTLRQLSRIAYPMNDSIGDEAYTLVTNYRKCLQSYDSLASRYLDVKWQLSTAVGPAVDDRRKSWS